MRKVNINNQDVEIRFNFATQISYEELSGKAFNAAEILPSDGSIPKSKDVMNLAIACLIVNNAPVGVEYILKEATYEESQSLIVAVIQDMVEWFTVPSVAESHVPETPTEEEGEPVPND